MGEAEKLALPVIFLDVDGVVNACPWDRAHPKSFDDWRSVRTGNFPILHSLQMGARLAALDAEIHWLTTWEHDANKYIAPLFGWEPHPVIEWVAYDKAKTWGKSVAAEKFVAEHQRPFIWIDDDLKDALASGEVEWVKDCTVSHLLISPNPGMGITPKQLDAMERFLAELREVAA